ncbi:MAG: NAD(P)/FAD-dependent oxidoreductase [Lachnospiraceae bacterium]|nr:NAD(P)/FAD-dependent oxidoreductase [Lachnospiraceae bacterium]
MKPYVIIGNGVAAAACIEGIRSIDVKTPITVISEENHPVYCRPLISYYLEGKTDPERMSYRASDFYEKMKCTVLYGERAVSINKRSKTVVLESGEGIQYSSVCLACGSSPFVPRFEGLENVKEPYSFMTLDDAEALGQALHKDAKVLIVGAGLIGLKCAEGIHGRAGHITVCDLAERVLSSILDTECAGMMQTAMEDAGIEFMLGDSVARFEENKAHMNSGKTVDFDILVLAVGVRANTYLLKDLGGEVGRGIVVNEKMETSVPNIYAAGDCTEGEDITLGGRRVLAIFPNAYLQGHAAGVNMAGGEEICNKGIPMNSIGFFGMHAMTAGSYYGEEDGGECFEERTKNTLKRLFVRDGKLTGFILIGITERAGIYTSLIREQTPLDQVDFEMLKKIASSAAFSQESRRQKFSRPV